jgi:hypothetical protein
MKEIKSVRVRKTNVKSGTLDIKVTLYEDKRIGADDRVLVGFNNDRPVWIQTTYRLKGIFKDFTDDQFITDFIDMNARSEGGGSEYEIIQDPWESKVPIWRKYGFDPYYLNNGAEIYINWTDENNMVVGGLTFSDSNGNEIDGQGVAGEGTVPVSITKSHWIVGVDDPSKEQNYLMHLTKNSEIDYRKIGDTQEYGGLFKDIYIVEDIIRAWKRKVPNYNELALCFPNNESCSIIPYKSPMKPIEPEPVPADVVPTNETPKEPITVVLPESVKVKIDTTFKIFIGKNKELIETETVLQDDELTDLSDEYTEGNFAGSEEQVLQLTGVDDEPVGPSFDEELAKEEGIENTPRGNPPIKGSKLTNKSGTSMINLAGHRLTPILKDLENYLNKNGYPGTKIGNNGVMRDLRGSAYPSSPARATASLHGVGLAIDVIFKIPGFKWSGIGDNANLARDAKLTQTIAAFIKGQSDIYWGASFGKSNPTAGEVNGRGITEYHHFEIKSDLIPGYWEPVKDELAKLGFKPSELKSPGKGKGLHRLMLKILGDSA